MKEEIKNLEMFVEHTSSMVNISRKHMKEMA